MSLKDGQQLRVVFPPHIYRALEEEAKQAGVTMADLIRLSVVERYRDKLQTRPLDPDTVTP